jgi:hypothetical protein
VRKSKKAIPQAMAEMSKIVGVELSTLLEKTRTLPVDYFGDTFHVTYKPDELSFLKEKERQEAEASQAANADDDEEKPPSIDAAENTIKRLSNVLVSWDLVMNGEPFPPTFVNLTRIPYAMMGRIWAAINGDSVPNQKTGKRS